MNFPLTPNLEKSNDIFEKKLKKSLFLVILGSFCPFFQIKRIFWKIGKNQKILATVENSKPTDRRTQYGSPTNSNQRKYIWSTSLSDLLLKFLKLFKFFDGLSQHKKFQKIQFSLGSTSENHIFNNLISISTITWTEKITYKYI